MWFGGLWRKDDPEHAASAIITQQLHQQQASIQESGVERKSAKGGKKATNTGKQCW
jgi:hypothetical protein